MNSRIDQIFLYLKQNIYIKELLLAPLVLFFLTHGPIPFRPSLLYNFLWGMFFFMLIERIYIKSTFSFEKKFLISFIGFLFLSSSLLIYSPLVLLIIILAIIIQLIVTYYKAEQVAYVKIIKYICLVLVGCVATKEDNFVWIISLIMGLIVFYYLKYKMRWQVSQKIGIILFVFFVSTKLSLRFMPF